MNRFLFVLLVGLGKAVAQPTPPEPAQLILYREKEFISRKAYLFTINGQGMGKLSPNRFVQLFIPAGRVKLEFRNDYFTDSRPLVMQVQAGQTYYIKAVLEIDFLKAMMLMEPVEPTKALQELHRMKPEVAPQRQPPD